MMFGCGLVGKYQKEVADFSKVLGEVYCIIMLKLGGEIKRCILKGVSWRIGKH